MQTPDPQSSSFKYYKNASTDVLVLKPDHDFPSEVVDGMDYDAFTCKILNKLGNLRIYYKDKNSGRQNSTIALKEYDKFDSYVDIWLAKWLKNLLTENASTGKKKILSKMVMPSVVADVVQKNRTIWYVLQNIIQTYFCIRH